VPWSEEGSRGSKEHSGGSQGNRRRPRANAPRRKRGVGSGGGPPLMFQSVERRIIRTTSGSHQAEFSSEGRGVRSSGGKPKRGMAAPDLTTYSRHVLSWRRTPSVASCRGRSRARGTGQKGPLHRAIGDFPGNRAKHYGESWGEGIRTWRKRAEIGKRGIPRLDEGGPFGAL